MRLVDIQMSVNGTAPGGEQYGQLQSATAYRFFNDIQEARKTNLQRQESAQPTQLTYASLPLQDQKTSYLNRVKQEHDRLLDKNKKNDKEDNDAKTEYGQLAKTYNTEPIYIDFSA